MAGGLGLVLGGLGGGILGAVGGIIEAQEKKAAISKFKREFRRGIAEGEARTDKRVFDILNSPEFLAAREFTLGAFGIQAPSNRAGFGNVVSFGGKDFFSAPTGQALSKQDAVAAQSLAGQIDQVLTAQRQLRTGVDFNGNPLSEQAQAALERQGDPARLENLVLAAENLDANQRNEFARSLNAFGVDPDEFVALRNSQLNRGQVSEGVGLDTGGGGGIIGQTETPLTADFRKRIQQAQTSRGIFSSQAAASAEASGLAAFEFEQRKQLLPQLLQLSTFGDTVQQQFLPLDISVRVQKQTGGLGVFGAQNNPLAGFTPSAGVSGLQGAIAGISAGASLGANLQGAFGGGNIGGQGGQGDNQFVSPGLRGQDIDDAFRRNRGGLL